MYICVRRRGASISSVSGQVVSHGLTHFVERGAPAVPAHSDAAVVAHRPLGCYCCEKTQQERRRDGATSPQRVRRRRPWSVVGLPEERFALRRANFARELTPRDGSGAKHSSLFGSAEPHTGATLSQASCEHGCEF